MNLYEVVDPSGKTVFELGRFNSDIQAKVAAKNILVPPSSILAKRVGSRLQAVNSSVKPNKEKLLAKLLSLCISGSDPEIAEMARMYMYE